MNVNYMEKIRQYEMVDNVVSENNILKNRFIKYQDVAILDLPPNYNRLITRNSNGEYCDCVASTNIDIASYPGDDIFNKDLWVCNPFAEMENTERMIVGFLFDKETKTNLLKTKEFPYDELEIVDCNNIELLMSLISIVNEPIIPSEPCNSVDESDVQIWIAENMFPKIIDYTDNWGYQSLEDKYFTPYSTMSYEYFVTQTIYLYLLTNFIASRESGNDDKANKYINMACKVFGENTTIRKEQYESVLSSFINQNIDTVSYKYENRKMVLECQTDMFEIMYYQLALLACKKDVDSRYIKTCQKCNHNFYATNGHEIYCRDCKSYYGSKNLYQKQWRDKARAKKNSL